MEATCPNCNTKNRAAARFCSSCTHSLAAETVLLTGGDDYEPTQIDLADHHPAFSEHALPDGTLIEGFRIVRPIGEGGFGIVYLAWDAALERHVAIKEYMPSSLVSRSHDSLDVTMRSDRHRDTFGAGLKSFVNEARLLARFDHPSLVKVFRFWEANRTAYMAMPFYEGPTLKSALMSLRGPVTEQQLRNWIGPLLDALTVIHKERCYHRDISPDNILLTPSGPLLLDFGAARRVITDRTQALTTMLKPGFAPIEQYGGEMLQGAWTDLYALAGVVHYAITGRPPVASVSRVVNDTVQPLAHTHAGRYSDSFLCAIDAALAVRPEARPQDVAQFRASLDAGDTTISGMASAADAELLDELDGNADEEPEALQHIPRNERAPSNETIDDYTLFVPATGAVPEPLIDSGALAFEPVAAPVGSTASQRDEPHDSPVASGATALPASSTAISASTTVTPRRRNPALYLVPALAVLMAAGATWWSLGGATTSPVDPAVRTTPAMSSASVAPQPAAMAVPSAPSAAIPASTMASTSTRSVATATSAPTTAMEPITTPVAASPGQPAAPAVIASPLLSASNSLPSEPARQRTTSAPKVASSSERQKPIGSTVGSQEPKRNTQPVTEVATAYSEAGKPPRCGDLVLKSSLETLNTEELGFLKSRCR